MSANGNITESETLQINMTDKITRDQIENSISNVLGKEINEAMMSGRIGLSSRHMAAALKCFETDRRDECSKIIRDAWCKLGKKGCYD